jgi:putative ABC transport system permease protein
MISVAYKMLIGNRSSCLGVIFGIFLATLLISQQSAIFLGLISRSYRVVTDIPEPTIWVMDPATEAEDKLRTLPISYIDIVRGTPGVEWAVPLGSTLIPVITPAGKFEISQIYGVDDATLIGAPTQMLEGSIRDLRREGGIIVDTYSANGSLAKTAADGSKIPLTLGDSLEINGKSAVVVGISKVTQGFYPQPIIFTSLSQLQKFNPGMTDRMSYALVKTWPDSDIAKIAATINQDPKLNALTSEGFEDKIVEFFLKTGILINFGLSVALGVIIGFSIAGQIFYMMTLDNTTNYAVIKAIGGTKNMILKMILFQALVVGVVGFALGIAITVLWGMAIEDTTLAFLFPWQLLVFSGSIVLLICLSTAAFSIRKVLHADPKMLMGT